MKKRIFEKKEEKVVNIRFDCDEGRYIGLKKIAVEKRLTLTAIFKQYIDYLLKKRGPKTFLNEESEENFDLMRK